MPRRIISPGDIEITFPHFSHFRMLPSKALSLKQPLLPASASTSLVKSEGSRYHGDVRPSARRPAASQVITSPIHSRPSFGHVTAMLSLSLKEFFIHCLLALFPTLTFNIELALLCLPIIINLYLVLCSSCAGRDIIMD